MRALAPPLLTLFGSALFVLVLATASAPSALAQPAPAGTATTGADTATQSEIAMDTRLKALEEELRCLVCQNQTLADSPSEWADGMRSEIRRKMSEGLGDQEIIDFLIARYGDFVTYKPPLKPSTYVLWFGPVLVLLVALLIVVFYVRRRSREEAPAELDEKAAQRARELLNEDRK